MRVSLLPSPAPASPWGGQRIDVAATYAPLSPAGRGRAPLASDSGGVRGRGQLLEKQRQNTVRIRKNIIVPEANDPIALPFEPGRSFRVIEVVSVLPAIDFDDESSLGTQEVHDVGADWHLPFELESEKSAIAQARPESTFCIGLVDPQHARPRHVSTLHQAPHPTLSPRGRGLEV